MPTHGPARNSRAIPKKERNSRAIPNNERDPRALSDKARDPRAFQFDLPADRRPALSPLAEVWHPLARDVWRGATSPRRLAPGEGISVLVIHATAGASSAGALSVMREARASFHWLVPSERETAHGVHVWACAPERRAAWHVANRCGHPDVLGGRGFLNHVSLGLEIVNAQDARDPFSGWQVAASAMIARYAWARYPTLRHVVSHAKLDPSRRTDPGPDFPWDVFREQVLR